MRGDSIGRHLLVDAFCNNIELLDSAEGLRQLLNELVLAVDMKLLLPAQTIRVELQPNKIDSDQDDGGITGFAILSTSHISVHTWPLTKRFSFDLFSCHDYDYDKLLAFLDTAFEITGKVVHNIVRESP